MYFGKKLHSNKQRIYTKWNKNFKLIQTAQNQCKMLKNYIALKQSAN